MVSMTVPQPIFILAPPRSFTSLSCAMLGQHPEVYGVPELHLFDFETLQIMLQQVQGKPRKVHGLLRTVAQLYSGEQTVLSIHMAQRWILNRLHCNTGEVYQELCKKAQPLRIVDKSPSYSLDIQRLYQIQKTFPGAHFLHLIRHPRPHGESLMKIVPMIRQVRGLKNSLGGSNKSILRHCINYSTDGPIIDFQFIWYRTHKKILDFLSTVPPEQQLRLRGEDLLSEPHQYFEKICHWLNLSWNESVIEAILHPEDSPFACFGPFGAQFGNDTNFLQSPALRQTNIKPSTLQGSLPWRKDEGEFIPAVVKLAQELGYN